MKMRTILTAILLLVILAGCNKKPQQEAELLQHFVTHYYDVDDFVLTQNQKWGNIEGSVGKLSLGIHIAVGEATEMWSFEDEGEKKRSMRLYV